MKIIRLAAALLSLAVAVVSDPGHAEDGIRRETVRFARGAASAELKGQLRGRDTVDYAVRAAAGQTLAVSLRSGNPQAYFNLLPPRSKDVAMFTGDVGGNDYRGLLPADGDYVLRVYLMRAAGRRDEVADYTLKVGVTGEPLAPTPVAKDARVPGTPYHASTTIRCRPAFETTLRDCEAFALRRGFGGNATVDVPGKTGTRSILFVAGQPVASNGFATDALGSERRGDVTIVKLGDQERYEIPDMLVSGG